MSTKQPAVTTLMRISDIKKATGMSSASIYRLIAQKKFPAQIELGARMVAWRRHEVQEWIDSRPLRGR